MNKRMVSNIIDLCFATLGILGTMGCFLNMYPLPIQNTIVYLLLAITSSLFFYLYSFVKERKNVMKKICILYAIIVIVTIPFWKDGLAYIMNTMFSVYENNSQYSFQRFTMSHDVAKAGYILYLTLWLIFTPVCAVIIRTLRGQHSYLLGFIVTVPFLFSILLFTLRPHPFYFYMVILFWFALAGMSCASHYSVYNYQDTIHKLGVLFTISGLVLLLGVGVLFPETSYVRDPNIESFRVAVQSKIRNFLEKRYDQEPGELDLRSAGNRIYINSDQLQVTMSEPTSLYLHGYSSSSYFNNKWSEVEYSNAYPLNNFTVTHPFNFALFEADRLTKTKVEVTYLGNESMYVYTPYYLLDDLRKTHDVKSDVYVTRGKDDGDTYTFQVANMEHVDASQYEPQLDQEVYYEMIKDANLNVPMQVKNFLSHFDVDGLRSTMSDAEKIATIQTFMKNFGTYTLSPGTTPEEEDFIEYFLMKAKEGYCVHYASAAVMLLRYNNIPARYASGYYVDKSTFNNGVATVKDFQEHAWVEILDPVFGWVPLEVTPTGSGGGSTQNPATNPSNPTQNPTLNNPNDSPNQNPTKPNTPTNNDSVNADANLLMNSLKFLGIAFLIVLVLAILPLRRKVMLYLHHKSLHQENAKQAIVYGGAYLERTHVIERIDPTIRAILDEAKYSNHSMSEEKRALVISYCESFVKECYMNRTKQQRFMDRYIHIYY